jgi:hypothetical protein
MTVRSMQSILIEDAGERDVLLVPQSATSSGATVAVVSFVEPGHSGLELRWNGADVVGVTDGSRKVGFTDISWHPWPSRDFEPMLWWARVTLVSAPGSDVDVEVYDTGDRRVAEAKTFTLASSLADYEGGRGIGIRVSSCFDQGRFHERPALSIDANGVGASRGGPIVNFMLGDQVYLDAPLMAIGRADRDDPEAHNARKYAKSFGEVGLGRVLADGPTWFLADDHEIWNDFPHPTLRLAQSTHETLELPWITAENAEQFRPTFRARLWQAISVSAATVLRVVQRDRTPGSTPLPDGDVASQSGAVRWMYSALDLYAIFQTPDEAPPTAEPDGWRPTTVRHVELARGIDAVFVDTRRMRQYKTEGESLMLAKEDSARARELIRTLGADAPDDTPRLLVLAFGEPLVGHRRTRAPASPWQRLKKFALGSTDHSAIEYSDYAGLVEAVAARAEAGLPTLLLGGDVHHSLIAMGRADRVVEVTSSPLALLRELRPTQKAVAPHAAGYRFLGPSRRRYSQYAEVHLGPTEAGNELDVVVDELVIDPETWQVGLEQRTSFRLLRTGVFERVSDASG